MPLSFLEATFIGTVLEGVFYGNICHSNYDVPISQFISSIGLYCIIFILYIRIHTSKQCADRNLLIYPISSLFVLCSAYFALDFSQQYFTIVSKTFPTMPDHDELMCIRPPDAKARVPTYSMESELGYQYTLFSY